MTSGRLWLLVAVIAGPLVVAANTGCDRVFGLSRASGSNAYTCECTCNAGPRDLPFRVSARSDDAAERRNTGSVVLGGSELSMSGEFLTGVRFSTLGIPPGATILSAHVQFTAAATDAAPASIDIRVEAADDAATFASSTSGISGRALGAPVGWSPPGWTSGDAGADQRTSDLATLIQTVASRPGWSATSSLVLVFDATAGSRVAVSFDGAGVRGPVLHVVFTDPTAGIAATLPVCLPEALNRNITPGAPNPDADGPDDDGDPDVLVSDCTGRVQQTYRGMVGACGFIADAAASCSCQLVQSGYTDKNENGTQDPGESVLSFTREICDVQPTCAEDLLNLPTDPNDPARCDNFDPRALTDCVARAIALCDELGIPRATCETNNCLGFVSATNAPGDEPVCVAHASAAPQPMAFQMFGRRSVCEVTGRSQIEVGDDGREPTKDPLTRGTLEILGGPCPGERCDVSLSTQLAMNPITFAVKWASDPTFSDLTQFGNSGLSVGTLDAGGIGTLPEQSTVGVGRGRRGSTREAILGSNASPLGLTVDWTGFACSLEGNLASSVGAEDVDGLCAGDGATLCRNDVPDCDAAGGPCELPDDSEPFVVNVALNGTLLNQPPTAIAGDDQTVECMSPAGASFLLDGTQSFDPDDVVIGHDIRIASWRAGHRVGPEIGASLQALASLGVGAGATYVLRVIDAYAQADEDLLTVEVVDSTPPDVFCNAARIVPPKKPVVFTATASDLCTATVVTPVLTAYQCFEINGAGARIDKTKSCKVSLNGASITIANTGGVGQHIAWTARALDGAGNAREISCEVEVANPGHS